MITLSNLNLKFYIIIRFNKMPIWYVDKNKMIEVNKKIKCAKL